MNLGIKLLTPATCAALLLAQVVVGATTNAQEPVQISTQVDRNAAQVAEPIRLTVTAHAPNGVRVSFPKAPTQLGDFDVINTDEKLDIPAPDGRTSTRTYVLESLSPGEHEIPPISISYVDGRSSATATESTQQVVESRAIKVAITSLLEGKTDPTKFRDIKGIVQIAPPESDNRTVVYAIAAITILAVVGLAAVFYMKKDRQISAKDWAIAELDRLVTERQAEQVNAQDFYIRVTDIVRQFIEWRFHIAAPRLTTAEFFERVKHNQQLTSYLQPLRSFLTTADMVKFAGVQPQVGDCETAIAKARQFVDASAAQLNEPSVANVTDSNSKKTSASTTRMKETA